MFVRLLAFLLIASPLMAGELDSFRTTSEIYDVSIKSKDPDVIRRNREFRNYGSVVSLGLQNSSTLKSKVLLKIPTAALQSKIPEANGARRFVYRFQMGAFSDTFTVVAHRMLKDWYEGGGQGTDSSYLSLGGCSYTHSKTPTGGRPTLPETVPSSMNWIDSGYVTSVKSQGGCNVCWDFAAIAQIEHVHKKDVFEGSVTYNSEDGTGADRGIAPIATDTASTSPITGNGWKAWKYPISLIDQAYANGLGGDVVFIADSGDVKVNSSENASNKPRIFIDIVTRSGAFYYDYSIQLTGTGLLDAYINSGAPTANYGAADTARINSSMKYLLRMDSVRALINAAVAADGSSANDTFQYSTNAVCSLNVTKYANATVLMYELLKVHFDESQVTYENWKTTSGAWTLDGAEATNELDLSESQVLNCLDDIDCGTGSHIESVFEYALTDSIMGERFFKYRGGLSANCPDNDTIADDVRIGWLHPFRFYSLDTLKKLLTIQSIAVEHWLHDSEPELVDYIWGPTDLCYYNGDTTYAGFAEINHVQLATGYNDDYVCDAGEGTGIWIMKNQYGSSRGKDGIYYMSYDSWLNFRFNGPDEDRAYIINYDSTATLWGEPGLEAGVDYDNAILGQVHVTAGGGWFELSLSPALVNGWRNGNIPNYGIVLTTNYSGASEQSWFSSELSAPEFGLDKAYFEVYSLDAVTKIGNSKIGNSSIGR